MTQCTSTTHLDSARRLAPPRPSASDPFDDPIGTVPGLGNDARDNDTIKTLHHGSLSRCLDGGVERQQIGPPRDSLD
jgi:hypothetical protein